MAEVLPRIAMGQKPGPLDTSDPGSASRPFPALSRTIVYSLMEMECQPGDLRGVFEGVLSGSSFRSPTTSHDE